MPKLVCQHCGRPDRQGNNYTREAFVNPVLKTAFAGLAATALFAWTPAQADSGDPIKIPIHNWSSQIVGANIVGKILTEAGYEAEYIPADSQVVYTSMCEGDIDLVHEVWQGAFGVAFEKVVDEGCVIDAATHDAKTREEWWYPSYVEEACPGLPDWKALNDCAEKFTTPETSPKGRFLAGPVDWLKHDHERVEGLEMNFEVVNAGSAAALWAELDSASKRKQPIVLFNWTPNFIEAIYDGKFIEFPAYDAAKDGYLKTGVWKGVPEKWPGAYKILQQVNFSNLDIAVMAKLADVDGMEPEEAADKWLADNEAKWRGWLKGSGS
jgi:glycine betaine/proline transport system substrate-binding protein